jgi:drug/metabolite transporter (DMT)-like permease
MTTSVGETPSPTRGWKGQYLLLGLIWGSSFFLIDAALTFLNPAGVTFWRSLLGAVTLTGLLLVRRTSFRIDRATLLHLWVVALLLNVIPGLLFAFAQERVSTVVASIVNTATPIMTLVVMITLFRDEHPTRRQVLGVLFGLGGALVALGFGEGGFGQNDPMGVIAVFGAITCYAFAYPYARKHALTRGHNSSTLATWQLLLATASLLPVYVLSGNFVTAIPSFGALIGFALLGIVSSGFAYIWNFNVVHRAGSAIASSVTYPTLIVSLVIGWLVLGESFTWNLPIGAAFIVAGSVIAQRGSGRFLRRLSRPSAVRILR